MSDLYYRVFGLNLQSNQPISGLVARPMPGSVDVVLEFTHLFEKGARQFTRDWFVTPHLSSAGEPLLHITTTPDREYFRFRYGDGQEFVLHREGTRVWIDQHEGRALEDTATYLLGPILGFVLRLRGIVTLHASAVAMDGRGVAFIGPHRAGKSTLAAIFIENGYPLISEDNAALTDSGAQILIHPGFPRVRLWADTASALYGSADVLARGAPMWDKRNLDLLPAGYAFQSEPVNLAAIYVLGERCANVRAPYLEPLSPREKMMALIANGRENLFLDQRMRAAEFQFFGNVAQKVRMTRVISHTDLARVPALCERVARDLRDVQTF